jgi:altronate hydrolase
VTAKGFVVMDTPDYDPVTVTGQVAGGAGLFNALSERGGACAAVKDVFPLSERSPV